MYEQVKQVCSTERDWGVEWCRPASSDMMDEHMFTIGIPNFVEFLHCKEKALYFCFITTMEQGPLPTAAPAGTTQ